MPAADDITDDAFLGGQLAILQPARGYRAGIDAVLLAAATPVTAGETVIDAGAGVGVVGLAIARRVPGSHVVLVERETVYADLAARNIERNGLVGRVRVILGDLTGIGPPEDLANGADQVVTNPPYQVAGRGRPPDDPLKASAHEMPAGSLEAWLRFCARATRPGGRLTLIHRADALGDLLTGLENRFGGLTIRPIHPRADAPAVRVLIHGVKGSRAPLSLAAPVVLHDTDGKFRPDIDAVLRAGVPL
jgi:tRNA1(Val) A37 N6-methylase TrmN6